MQALKMMRSRHVLLSVLAALCLAVPVLLSAAPPAAAQESADLKITKSVNRDRVPVGQNVTFKIVLTNLGPNAATGISFGDSVPDALNFVSLSCSTGTAQGSFCLIDQMEPGERAVAILVATPIPNLAPGEEQIENTAFVESDTPDPNSANNHASAHVLAIKDADLALTKTTETKRARVGDNVTYTIKLTNRGPAAAFNVLVGEGAPDQLGVTTVDCGDGIHVPQFSFACFFDRLDKGQTKVITFVATVTLDASPGMLVTNQAFIAESSAPDPRADNNVGSATIRIVE